MQAPSTVEVSCPACGEPIVLSLSLTAVDPEPGDPAAYVDVSVDAERRVQSHGEVCPAGGGR
ncbi:hypothetical protein FGG44_gp06 [Mycobacterium phage MacnCheese]|uniref:Uncharacterized protein n=1 Tax=Mycobacterium phage MacnCheese TaxID=2927982 RepID=I6XD76_9CAUD|nr:hypothetical protein FGG44_gp06 [Mycobacterium phage MacnCheese]AFN37796.1 hypothetical protein MACNCHEESE_6 [Mycobacterium phage MacnCheese]